MSTTTKKTIMAAGLSAVILAGTNASTGQVGKDTAAGQNLRFDVPALPESNVAEKAATRLAAPGRGEITGTSGRLPMQSFRLPATATRG